MLSLSQMKGVEEMIQEARTEGPVGSKARVRQVALLGDVQASPGARRPRDVAEAR